MRVLWSLPKAAPLLVEHLAAYLELAGRDLARARREFAALALAAAIVLVGAAFTLLMICLAVVALTWDGPHRVAAIAGMGAFFLAATLLAALRGANVLRDRAPFLDAVRREWREDRVILEQVLTAEDE